MNRIYVDIETILSDYKQLVTSNAKDKSINGYLAINNLLIEADKITPPAILSKVGYKTLIEHVKDNYTQILGELHSIVTYIKLGGIDYDDLKAIIVSSSNVYMTEKNMPDTIKVYNEIDENIEEWQFIIYIIIMFSKN